MTYITYIEIKSIDLNNKESFQIEIVNFNPCCSVFELLYKSCIIGLNINEDKTPKASFILFASPVPLEIQGCPFCLTPIKFEKTGEKTRQMIEYKFTEKRKKYVWIE